MFTILLCKFLCWLGAKLGRGSSFPGAVCLKLSPRALRHLRLPDTVIAVTGSNGKTSTAALLCALAEKAGKKVLCNREGSNQKEGVATLLLKNANPITRRVKADVVVLESDERFCQYTFADFAPSHILVTNLFRDQLTRNGHPDFVKGELAKGLPAKSTLILNGCEPISCSLAAGHDRVVYYGVTAPQLREPEGLAHACDDGAFCPVCRNPMTYASRIAGPVGDYACRVCGFRRPPLAHAVTSVDSGGRFVLDGVWHCRPQLGNTAYAQNIAAAYTAGVEAMGLAPQQAAQLLDGIELENGRLVDFTLAGHGGLFMLCKHENSMAYNGAIATALDGGETLTVALIVDRLSRKYVANDMSWLWDIDFERLADRRVKRVIVSGGFAHDVAARLLQAGVPPAQLTVEPDLDAMMRALAAQAEGRIYVFTCFTDQNKFLSRLKKMGGGEA